MINARDVNKRALWISFLNGISKALFCMAITMAAWKGGPVDRVVFAFCFAISMALWFEFVFCYKPNMVAHESLMLARHVAYTEEFECALREKGLREMLREGWFVKKAEALNVELS